MPKALSEEQVARYRRDGFLFPLPALSPAEAAHYRRALEAYETRAGEPLSRDSDPDEPIHWALLAFAWDESGNDDKAVSCLEQAVLRAPDVGMIQIALAGLRAKQGDRKHALAGLKAYVELHPEDSDAARALAAMAR